MSYQVKDKGLIDYQLCELEESAPLGLNIPIRRPVPTRPGFIACIGAAQTFGRYVHRPFGQRLGERLGVECALIAKGGTGPEYWLDEQPEMITHLSEAAVTVVQVMSARSVSSSFVRRPEWVGVARKKIDKMLAAGDTAGIEQYVKESRENWLNQMGRLLDAIPSKKVLFWFAQRPPDKRGEGAAGGHPWGSFPHMVNRQMVDLLIPHADAYVEYVSSEGLPVALGVDAKGKERSNNYYPSQEMHDGAALALESTVRGLIGA